MPPRTTPAPASAPPRRSSDARVTPPSAIRASGHGGAHRGLGGVVVVAVGGARQRALELPQAAAEGLPGVGQALRAQDDEGDDEDDEDLGDADSGHHGWTPDCW